MGNGSTKYLMCSGSLVLSIIVAADVPRPYYFWQVISLAPKYWMSPEQNG